MLKLKRSLWIFVLSCLVPVLLPVPGVAQGVEIFGGYQFTHLQPAFNASGWNASLTKNFQHVLGITGDFSGAYKSNFNAHTYTVGPVLTARLPAVQPFAHALFGGIATSSDRGLNNGREGDNGFAMLLGGGIDVGWRKGVGIRIVQLDWLHTDVNDVSRDKNLRASAGIVVKF